MSAERGPVFERRFRNQLVALAAITEEALAFLEAQNAGTKAINLAHLTIEELATNIIKYGYDDAAPHEILLQLRVDPGGLQVLLEDDGHEFNPLMFPEPSLDAPVEQREPGGFGIHLVRKLATRMDYERTDGRNRVAVHIGTGASDGE